jgi:hypothetical protein
VLVVESVSYLPDAGGARAATNDEWDGVLLENDYVRAGDTDVNSFYVDRRAATVRAAAAAIWPG